MCADGPYPLRSVDRRVSPPGTDGCSSPWLVAYRNEQSPKGEQMITGVPDGLPKPPGPDRAVLAVLTDGAIGLPPVTETPRNLMGAVSSGQCITGRCCACHEHVQRLRRGSPPQRHPRPPVAFGGDHVEVVLGDLRQVHALGKDWRHNPLGFSLEPRCQGEGGVLPGRRGTAPSAAAVAGAGTVGPTGELPPLSAEEVTVAQALWTLPMRYRQVLVLYVGHGDSAPASWIAFDDITLGRQLQWRHRHQARARTPDGPPSPGTSKGPTLALHPAR